MSIMTRVPNQASRLLFPIDRAVFALKAELEKLGYNATTISEILPFAHDEGDLTGAIELGMCDPEDIERLTEAFVNGFDPVHPSSPLWLDRTTWSADPAPTAEESREYARLIGEFDSEPPTLVPPPELTDGPEPAWDEWALYSAMLDARDGLPSYEEQELAEVGISRR